MSVRVEGENSGESRTPAPEAGKKNQGGKPAHTARINHPEETGLLLLTLLRSFLFLGGHFASPPIATGGLVKKDHHSVCQEAVR
jgi:hypothetical protein